MSGSRDSSDRELRRAMTDNPDCCPGRDGWLTWLPCVCGNVSYRVVFKGGPQQGVQRFCVLRCSSCGLLRTHPLPQPSDAGDRGTYTSAEYHDALLNVDQRCIYANFALDEVERRKHPPGTLLDIGCNIGLLVRLAAERGWDSYGVDIDWGAVSYGSKKFGVRLICADLRDAELPLASFDIVVMNHVLEHVAEPVGLLNAISQLLAKDGYLFVWVPNYGGLVAKLLRSSLVQRLGYFWYGLDPQRHVWQFDPRGMVSLLRHIASLYVVNMSYSQSLDYFPERHWEGRMVQPLLKLSELVNLGDQMMVVARRASPRHEDPAGQRFWPHIAPEGNSNRS